MLTLKVGIYEQVPSNPYSRSTTPFIGLGPEGRGYTSSALKLLDLLAD